jgi:hypothetical protein
VSTLAGLFGDDEEIGDAEDDDEIDAELELMLAEVCEPVESAIDAGEVYRLETAMMTET